MRMALVLIVLATACNRSGLPAHTSQGCGNGSDSPVLIAATSQQIRLLNGDGTVRELAAFSDGGYTQFALAPAQLAVAHVAANKSHVALFDRSGSPVWERDIAGTPALGGVLADGTVIADDENAGTTNRVGPASEQVVATGAHTRWVGSDWILLEYDPPAASGAAPPPPRYEWRRPATGEAAGIPAGWSFRAEGLFVRDAGDVALFEPGASTPSATRSLASGAVSPTGNFSDGGGDFVFDTYYPTTDASADFVWRVARDLSSAKKLALNGAVGLPTMDATGALFTFTRTAGALQPIWSPAGDGSFTPLGSSVASEFGGSVEVRGTTAAISIAEGDTYVEPPYLQIFYRHQPMPQVLRASQHSFTSFTLSPDGECAAYYELDAGSWQLVVRALGTQTETRPGKPANEQFSNELQIAWWR